MAPKPRRKGINPYSGQVKNTAGAHAAKVDIRRRVLEMIVPFDAAVFDAYAGEGVMHAEVWSSAARYVGCDKEWKRDSRMMFACDNRRVLRVVDLAPFNIFDLDAYGSPWECAIIIADRRRVKPGELVGLVLTEGSGLGLKMNSASGALMMLAGLRPGHVQGLAGKHDDLINRAIAGLTRRMGCDVVKRWQASGKSGVMRYIAMVVRGQGATA